MKPISRREFAAPALAAALAAKADAAQEGAAGEWRNRQSGMAYRRLGRTGFHISEIVMGGNTISPANWEHVLLALDMGLNYLDTAPAYGNGKSELGYAQVLKARKRDTFFLNTKVSLWDINRTKLYADLFASLSESEQKKTQRLAQEEMERRGVLDRDYLGEYFPSQAGELKGAALANVLARRYGGRIDRGKNYKQIILDSFEESMKRLGAGYTDLLMCPHGASTPEEVSRHPEIFEAFEKLKREGRVRHLGVSAHNDPAGVLEAAIGTGVYSVAMVAYSIVNQKWMEPVLRKAKRKDFGVVAMKVARPVYNGRGNGTPDDPARVKLIEDAMPGPWKRPQKAYLWALRNPNLSAVISEITNAGMVRDNLPLASPKKG